MSISTTATKDSYAGNNSIVTQYPITFKYFEESHISVYFDGVLQTKGAGADYEMGGDGTTSTGYITTNVAQADTVTVAITLDVPFDQPVVLQETGSLPAKTIEVEGFDRLNMQVRRVWRKLQDVLTFNTDEANGSTGTADNLIGFDGSGDIAEIPNTTFLQTANDLSDLNDAATARTNLGVDAAGTDNSTDVTKTGAGTYISLAGQVLTVDAITESDISDLGAYIENVTGSPLSELQDVTITTPSTSQVLAWNGSAWVNTTAGNGDAVIASGLDQFAATTSAELAGVISDETGSGALVFATSPTLVTPDLGTPSAVDLTNATNTPLPAAGTVTEAMLNVSTNASLDLADSALQTIASDSITYDMVQDVTATDKILGRSTAGAGTVEEIACTSAGRALLDDADAEAQRNTLGANLVFDVRNYGTVGDGTTDDGVAIQAAITAAEASVTDNPGYYVDGASMPVVDLAGGVYGISEANKLLIRRRIRFQNGTLNAVGVAWAGSSVFTLTTFCDGAILDGVNIDGGITADGLDGEANGIVTRGVKNVIQNCKITHFKTHGIRAYTSNEQIISNCVIAKWRGTDTNYALAASRTGSGILLESDHNRVDNCTIIDCGKSVEVQSGSALNMIYGCRFWSLGITTPVGGEGQVEVGHVRIHFTNCFFDGVRVSILDNRYESYFTACGWNKDQDAEAIYVDTTATGETVGGLNVVNSFFNSTFASPITFNGTGTYADDIDKKINWLANVDKDGESAWYGAKFGAGNQITGGVIGIADGVTAPSTVTGVAQLYVDTADGDLKVKFGDGTVVVLAAG